VTYASFITLRGLWLGPLLLERYGFSLLQTGNAALAVSAVSLLGPPVFGRLDPMGAKRRPRIVGFSLFMAAAFALLAFVHEPVTGVATMLVIGFLTGFIVWQYADVRGAYPEALTGRAMAVFTMAMFLGVALVQWLTGVIATLALAAGFDPYTAVLLGTAALVALGTVAFRSLPAPHSAP
jgi:predicted MFS family arabinose efflux permease